jgi:hypothetical protein
MLWLLRVVAGADRGRMIGVEPGVELRVGHAPAADLRLEDPSVSAVHARLVVRERDLELFDEGSAAGVFVDGARVERATVGHDARLGIGSVVIKVTKDYAPAGIEIVSNGRPRAPVRHHARVFDRKGGSFDEVPLDDLLRILMTSPLTKTLELDCREGWAEIVIAGGAIAGLTVHLHEADAAFPSDPAPAILRMLRWHGQYELRNGGRASLDRPVPITEVLEPSR